jgi:hypothetical protein
VASAGLPHEVADLGDRGIDFVGLGRDLVGQVDDAAVA